MIIATSPQRIQNSMGRTVTRSTCGADHIMPVLADLHWLPVQYIIEFKVAVTTFEVVDYTRTTLSVQPSPAPSRNLRSSCRNLLREVGAELCCADRAFCKADLDVWNSQNVTGDRLT